MASIKKQLISGVFYTSISKYVGILVTLVVSGVLARLISPADFGAVTVATVIIAFFAIFSDLGIGPAIIQKKELTKDDLDSIFSLTIYSGFIVSSAFFGLSWLVSSLYKSEILKIVCQLLSLNLMFAAADIVPNALIFKAKRFKFVAMRSLSVQLLCGVVAVVAALLGAGIFALLINPIVSSIVLFIINYRQNPLRLHLHIQKESVKKVFSFSVYQLSFNVINYFSRNLDKLLMGRAMSMTDLGYYDKSYRLMMLPLQNISYVLVPVMHPIFSDLQNDLQALSKEYLKVVKLLSYIGFPLAALLFFIGRELIVLIFGAGWMPSVPVFQILSLTVGVQIILSTSGSIFQAANATKQLFLCGVFSSVLNVLAICVGVFVFGTLNAVAYGICISFAINFIQCYYEMYYHTFKVSWLPFWKQLISPIIISVVIAALLWVIASFVDSMNVFVSLCIKSFVAIVVLFVYLQLSHEYNVIGMIRRILPHKKSPV